MDVLKYCFRIDPAREDRERMQKQKKLVKPRTAIRFVYVHPLTN